jgi:hypothetical protein
VTPDVTAGEYAAGGTSIREAAMRQAQVQSGMIGGLFLLVVMSGTCRAESGFDEKYQRDFNIFNPINQYQPGNPLNPISAYDPTNPFNPLNRFDPATPSIRPTSSTPTIPSIRSIVIGLRIR